MAPKRSHNIAALSILTLFSLLSISFFILPLATDSFQAPLLAILKAYSSNPVSPAGVVVDRRIPHPTNRDVSDDMEVIYKRRVSSIVGGLAAPSNISQWLASLGNNGKWPDSEVDYTTGCEARRANWPAQEHWQRILVMSGAWSGGAANASQWANNTQLRNATGLAMAYWFSRDFNPDVACIDQGGTAACPCTNPRNTLWNTNWYSNVILIPRLVGQSCILLKASLTPTESSSCGVMTTRSFYRFGTGAGYLAGANILDIGRISVDAALLTNNATMLTAAYRYVHDELTIRNTLKADGIRPDGSFGQHVGIIYNGNYGKDYSNAALDLEIAAGGTQFAAASGSRTALETLFQGDRWMIFTNTLTQVLHFDFSTIGRMITFPVIDNQASASIQMNLTTVLELGTLWSSTPLIDFANQLMSKSSTANAGNLRGNKMFYANDYMVHRGSNFVSTLRMYSRRTTNTECVNTQNPKGFHLSDGTMYTFIKGDEYEDISASWDWDLIPGITVDYLQTPLNCSSVSFSTTESFVGGASDGLAGVAAMRYTNPATGSLRWQKTWFFLESGVFHVMVNIIASNSNAPVYSVLEQKRLSGPTFVSGVSSTQNTWTNPSTLWHSNVGYAFRGTSATPVHLQLRKGPTVGNWSAIGTSTQPPPTVNLWAAWLEHRNTTAPVEYSIWPGMSQPDFQQNSTQSPIQTVENSRDVSAIYDLQGNRGMVVFWGTGGGSTVLRSTPALAPLTISSRAGVIVILSLNNGTVVVSDPSQTLQNTSVTFAFGTGGLPPFWTGNRTKTLEIAFPTAGLAGSSVNVHL